VTETDQEARDYLADDQSSYGWYYRYLRSNLATYNLLKIFKPSEDIPDEAVTYPKCVEWMIMHGSPATVLDQLVAMVDEIGSFGMLLLTHKDWNDNPELHRRSMRLFAEQVMPRFRKHMASLEMAV
jgi:alkanesulfonate monooxygenase SsuD/methylene tetrahydromethanopterin reductase-like flavin-dependent oxidoreductase (luciferase family)